MKTHTSRFALGRAARTLALSLLLCPAVQAQTPARPAANPAQQDATRPPNSERQSVPTEAQTRRADPTAPPGTERPAPQTPPGTTSAAPASGPAVTTESAAPAPANAVSQPAPEVDAAPAETLQPRTAPPPPRLARLGVSGDKSLALTLDEAIRRALENNNDIEIARDDVRFAETGLRSLEGVYEPVIQLTPQLSSFVTPQSSTLGGSDQSGSVSRTILDFGPSLTKQFRKGGGQYQFFFNNARETTSSTFAQLSPNYAASLGVTFTQPLLRDREIDNNRRLIRIQRRRLAQTDADFRRRTMDVIARVQRAYWELVFALRDQQNRVHNLNLIREQFQQTEHRIEAGSVAPLERAEVQTEFANRESDVLASAQSVSVAENNLKQLILRDPLAAEWSAALVPVDEPTFDEDSPVNLEDSLREARAARPELRRMQLQQEITEIDIAYFKNQTKPRIDLQATVSTTGLAGSPVETVAAGSPGARVPLISGDPASSASAFLLSEVNRLRAAQGLGAVAVPLVNAQGAASVPPSLSGGYGQMLANLASFKTRNVVVGVTIQFPLRNKTAEADLAGAKIQQRQVASMLRQEEQVVEAEVRNAAQAAETARLRVLTARKARENAELQMKGEKRLYEVGRSTTFLLFQRENQLANSRNLELRAKTDYHKALADLQRATSTTLRANRVVVETPLD